MACYRNSFFKEENELICLMLELAIPVLSRKHIHIHGPGREVFRGYVIFADRSRRLHEPNHCYELYPLRSNSPTQQSRSGSTELDH
jgi:hypothetical protein